MSEKNDISETRKTWQSIWRGLMCKCPHCNEGKLFSAYLKPVLACEKCGEDYSHQRADDLPPYICIVIAGKILGTLAILAYDFMPESILLQLAIWIPLTLVTILATLQPIKGGVVGLQWAKKMHGFDGEANAYDESTLVVNH